MSHSADTPPHIPSPDDNGNDNDYSNNNGNGNAFGKSSSYSST